MEDAFFNLKEPEDPPSRSSFARFFNSQKFVYDCPEISMIREKLDKLKKSLNRKHMQNINYIAILFLCYTLTDKVYDRVLSFRIFSGF